MNTIGSRLGDSSGNGAEGPKGDSRKGAKSPPKENHEQGKIAERLGTGTTSDTAGAATLQGVRNGIGVTAEKLDDAVKAAMARLLKNQKEFEDVLASLNAVLGFDNHAYAKELKNLIGAFTQNQLTGMENLANLRQKAETVIVEDILSPLGLRGTKTDGSDFSSTEDVAERLNTVLEYIDNIVDQLKEQSENIAGESDSVMSTLKRLGDAQNQNLSGDLESTKATFNGIVGGTASDAASFETVIAQLQSILENVQKIQALLR